MNNGAYDDSKAAIRAIIVSGANVGVGTQAIYQPTPPTLASGASTYLYTDVSGNLLVSENTLLAGEDLTNNRLLVQISNSYQSLSSLVTITPKSGAGVLHTITVGGPSMPTINIWDSLTATGTLIGTIQANAPVTTFTYDVAFSTGLTIQPLPAGIIPNYLISYR